MNLKGNKTLVRKEVNNINKFKINHKQNIN